ncbi:hypothetical protein MLD38_017327 [Melastoma candidum]|uniref:Uncharacterized protein n=1 Tax=Melastoma candidum TaxID=119954 RepID=A0ACB9QRF3_9MYRT|nr:hypothetical protein MLD38_017327 [Melastoma candidum]
MMSTTCFILLLLLLLAVKVVSQEETNLLRIDCGIDSNYESGKSTWVTDDAFIKIGENKQVPESSLTKLTQLNTLRAFTQQNKNCYTLPIPIPGSYFIRPVFYYGNYDGKLQPPTFDLEFDGNKWATVMTSASQVHFYEIIYTTKRQNVKVCLARTQAGQFPFISVLEIWPLGVNMYDKIDRDLAWQNSYRYNYGAGSDNLDNWILGYPDDPYNRFWRPMDIQGTKSVLADVTPFTDTGDNEPPIGAILNAIEAVDPPDTINLSFPLYKASNLNYVVVYFTETNPLTGNNSRVMDLYVDDEYVDVISPDYGNCTWGWINNIRSESTINVRLQKNGSSNLPPLISAIEVFTATDPLVTVATSQDDLEGLQALINAFDQLSGWVGEPCLPNNTVWQWLTCAGNNPPRVTQMDLSGYGLSGQLPDFGSMQALETINLSNNSLHGEIPSFLGNLRNLRLLDLQNNNFSGKVPETITRNKKIDYKIDMNSNLHRPKRKNLALIVGLSVGIPLGLASVLALAYFLSRRPPPANPGQYTLADLSRPQSERNKVKPQQNSSSFSSRPLIQPSENRQNFQGQFPSSSSLNQGSQTQFQPTSTTANLARGVMVRAGDSLAFQGIDQAELDELLYLHLHNTKPNYF